MWPYSTAAVKSMKQLNTADHLQQLYIVLTFEFLHLHQFLCGKGAITKSRGIFTYLNQGFTQLLFINLQNYIFYFFVRQTEGTQEYCWNSVIHHQNQKGHKERCTKALVATHKPYLHLNCVSQLRSLPYKQMLHEAHYWSLTYNEFPF